MQKNSLGKLSKIRDYWYLSQNYDLPQGTESNSRKGTNNLFKRSTND